MSKVVSQEQLAANRANAKRSTGPRTSAGKARAAANGFQHCLISADLVLGDDDLAEDRDRFDKLLRDLLEQFDPKDEFETMLIERIATCYWRLRRAIRFESKAILKSRRHSQSPMVELSRQLVGQKNDPLDIVLPHRDDLDRLVSYESMIDRQLHRTIAQLRRHRTPLQEKHLLSTVVSAEGSDDCQPEK